MLGISKQKVNYWLKTEIKTEVKRKTKLDEEEIKTIVKMAENKPTSEMGSRKIAEIMNEELKKKGKTIGKSAICNYLKKNGIKALKMKKVFALNEKQNKAN